MARFLHDPVQIVHTFGIQPLGVAFLDGLAEADHVTDGGLDIGLIPIADSPVIAAIEIRPAGR